MNPKISVIMPVYNAELYIGEAIESILNQTFSDFELIILNDNSTDSSLEIIKNYTGQDNRIIVVDKQKNVGPALLRNEGFDCANGEFIALMDADDIANKLRFEKQIAVFNSNSEIGVCGTWYTMFGTNIEDYIFKQDEFHNEIKVKMLYECCIGNPTAMIRKQYLTDFRYNPEMVPIEDYDLWTRLIKITKFYNIQESLLMYRWHDTNITKSKKENSDKMHRIVWLNQLKEFGIHKNKNELDSFLNTIYYRKKQPAFEILKIIENKRHLISQNRNIKKYDFELFENQINYTLKQTIKRGLNYNLKDLKTIYKNEYQTFNSLKLKYKVTIILKSIIGSLYHKY